MQPILNFEVMAVRDIKLIKIAFAEKYTLISWVLAILGVLSVRESACVNVSLFGSDNPSTR